ncbi:hypothetical protein L7F22_062832 [Adiantum nelumboides]|nr:hypothetical protein [Adiantum nelumboides]
MYCSCSIASFLCLLDLTTSSLPMKQQIQLSSSKGRYQHVDKQIEQELEDDLEDEHLIHIPEGASLDIYAGTVVGIIGPSGGGKSTLLRALNRLWEPPPDSVFLDAQDITKLDVISVRRRVGMLFQLPALFDELQIIFRPIQITC